VGVLEGMTTKHFAALAAVAALAAPTAATAKSDHAASHESHGKGHAKAKNAVLKGAVVSVDAAAGSVVLHVDKANKWGRSLKGTDVTFTVAAVKRLGVRDTNGDGKRDLADVKAGDKAQAQAKVAKDAPQPFAARKLKVYAPEGSEGTEEGAETEGTEKD
jgi:ABC-type uncharacterized transport system ATPase subunit